MGINKQRKEQNQILKYFFIINKIDKAFSDNEKIEDIKIQSSEEEYFANIKKHWNYNENIAIEKIKNSAKKYDFKSPKVFTVSSKFIEYYRNRTNLNFYHLDEIDIHKTFSKIVSKKFG